MKYTDVPIESLPRLWGFIPYHPDGEISVGDFILASETEESLQKRMHSNFIQTAINVALICIFISNSWRAFKLLRLQPKGLANWCCMIQAVMGVIMAMVNILSIFPGGPRCRINIWVCAFGITLSAICVNICLLIKAYAAQRRDRRLIWLSVLLMIPQPSIIWIAWTECIMMNTEESACIILFPPYLPWLRFILDMLINTLFSTVFLYAVYRQYRIMGSDCWGKLAKDGMLFMLAVLTSNIICAIITATGPFGPLSEMFFLIDCK
jgi:hypothetical protein